MDELKLKLSTKIMKGLIGTLLSKAVSKKLGCDIDILLNDIELKTENGEIHLHADVDAKIDNNEFVKILKTIKLD